MSHSFKTHAAAERFASAYAAAGFVYRIDQREAWWVVTFYR